MYLSSTKPSSSTWQDHGMHKLSSDSLLTNSNSTYATRVSSKTTIEACSSVRSSDSTVNNNLGSLEKGHSTAKNVNFFKEYNPSKPVVYTAKEMRAILVSMQRSNALRSYRSDDSMNIKKHLLPNKTTTMKPPPTLIERAAQSLRNFNNQETARTLSSTKNLPKVSGRHIVLEESDSQKDRLTAQTDPTRKPDGGKKSALEELLQPSKQGKTELKYGLVVQFPPDEDA